MPRRGQTKISDHFSPKSKAKYPVASFKAGIPVRDDPDLDDLDSDRDSAGSQGLETIQLGSKKTERVNNGTLSQKREGNRAVFDEDEGEDQQDVEYEDGNDVGSVLVPMQTLGGRAGPSRIQISPTPESDSGSRRQSTKVQLPIPIRYTRQHSTKISTNTSSSKMKPPAQVEYKNSSSASASKDRFHIELPHLSQEERSRYSPWGSQPPESSASVQPSGCTKQRSLEVVLIEEEDEPVVLDSEGDIPLRSTKNAKTRSTTAKAISTRPSASKTKAAKPRRFRPITTNGDDGDPMDASSEGEDELPLTRSARGKAKTISSASVVGSKRRAATPPRSEKKRGRKKARKHDPDDDDDVATEEEEDILAGIQMEEPSRFKSKTRLRPKKETEFQSNLRRLKRKKLGIVDASTGSEEEEDADDDDDDDSEEEDGLENWIIEDGKQIEDGLLPHQFSLNYAQTPEFKFKVAFHYFLLLAMEGPRVLPLKGDNANYFLPQLTDLRRRMDGFKDGRVRSQIWEKSFVEKLEKYPEFDTVHLEYAEPGCDACRIGQRMSTFRVRLEGEPYDRKTHESMEDNDTSSASSSESDDSEAARGKNRELLMGKYCYRRAYCFHRMSHWEHELLDRIRIRYHDMLRAKGRGVPDDSDASESSDDEEDKRELDIKRQRTKQRVDNLRRSALPAAYKSVDEVLQWMERTRFQTEQFRWLEDLEEQSRRLEHDKSKDE